MKLKSKLGENSHGARPVIQLYKKRGETPLECLERFKKDNPEYKDEKMTYAGRLDPLAEGLLLVLVGDECKNKEKYLNLDKEYEVDVLFGFATDTYDVLGVVCNQEPQTNADWTQTDAEKCNHLDTKCPSSCVILANAGIHAELINLDSRLRGNDTIKELLNSFIGRFSQKYPAYSSKNIKRILKYRKNGGLALRSEAEKGESLVFSEMDEDITEKEVEIKSINFLGQKTISKKELEKYIKESIALVKGDFRQKEILETWQKLFKPCLKSDTGCAISTEAGIQNEKIYSRYSRSHLEGEGLIRTNGGYTEDCKCGVIPTGIERLYKEQGDVAIHVLDPRLCGDNKEYLVVSIRVNCTSGTYMRSLANSIGVKVGIPALALNIKRTRIGDSF